MSKQLTFWTLTKIGTGLAVITASAQQLKNEKITNLCLNCNKFVTLPETSAVFKRSYCYLSQFDPPYLKSLKPEIPEYGPVNIQMKGYDFALLESYQSFVHRIAKTMEIEVEEGWATPATISKIKKFKPNSSNIDCEYTLSLYERNVQVVDVPSTKMTMFVELVQAALPQGISLSVHEHQQEHEEIRYVPDYELKELKTQLETLSQKKK
ncbi:39S ribosomal protein L48, mitochondrial [Homalodisca vitripennis]|nr:39S ribosomal protein L48, mitochondrial [Homalodisca vitripennis]